MGHQRRNLGNQQETPTQPLFHKGRNRLGRAVSQSFLFLKPNQTSVHWYFRKDTRCRNGTDRISIAQASSFGSPPFVRTALHPFPFKQLSENSFRFPIFYSLGTSRRQSTNLRQLTSAYQCKTDAPEKFPPWQLSHPACSRSPISYSLPNTTSMSISSRSISKRNSSS